MATPNLPTPDGANGLRPDPELRRALAQFEAAQTELARRNPDLSPEEWSRLADEIADDVDQALRDRFGGAASRRRS